MYSAKRRFRLLRHPGWASAPAPVTTYDTLTLVNGSSSVDYQDGFLAKYTTAGRLNWTARIGGVNSESILHVVTDVSNNMYVLASAYAPLSTSQMSVFNANGTTGATLTVPSNSDLLVKYNSFGSFQWLIPISDGVSLKTDASGNVYCLHTTTGNSYTVNRPGQTLAFTITFTKISSKALVVRYTSSGQPSLIGYIQLGTAQDISVDPSGNVYVAGQQVSYPEGSPVYNSNKVLTMSVPYNSNYAQTAYLVKYNSSGTPQWYATQRSEYTQQTWAITTDTSGNVYIVGEFSGVVDIYNSDDTLGASLIGDANTADFVNIFIGKYNSSGILQWAAHINTMGYTGGQSIATDSSGNVFIGGPYYTIGEVATLYNADGTPSTKTLPIASVFKVFVAKYNSVGVAQWAIGVGGTNGDTYGKIAMDSTGNVYLGGSYTVSPLRFYDTSGTVLATPSLANSGDNDSFLAKYDSEGVLIWATRMDGTVAESTTSVSVDASNNICVTGSYTSKPLTLRSVGF